jgi:hypothetical protein
MGHDMVLKTITAFALAFLICFSPAPLIAQDKDIIGTILEVEGTGTIQADNTKKEATVNTPIHTGDMILTGPQSRIFLLLIDNTELTLSENGQLSVDDYIFNEEDKTNNKAVYSILKGAFLYASGEIAKKKNPDVILNIPAGSIGIRGTRFWGGDIDGSYGLLVGEGEVEINTGTGPVRLKTNGTATLKGRGLKPDTSKTWTPDKIKRAISQIVLKNPETVSARMKAEIKERQPLLRKRHLKQHQNKKMDGIRAQPMRSNTPSEFIKRKDIENKKEATNPEIKKQDTPEKDFPRKASDSENPALQKQRLMDRLKERGL